MTQERPTAAHSAGEAGVHPSGKGIIAEPFSHVADIETARNGAETALQDPLARFQAMVSGVSDEDCERRMREAEADREREEQARRLARFEELCPAVYRHPAILAAMRERTPARTLREIMAWHPADLKPGLLLHGETGGFKTTMLFQIARRLIVEEGARKVVLLQGNNLTAEAAAAFGDASKTEAWIAPFKRAGVLLVDELFKGAMTPSAMNALFAIVEHRTAHLLPTVATTNATAETLQARVWDKTAEDALAPILRRIRGADGMPGFFQCIHIPAPGSRRPASESFS